MNLRLLKEFAVRSTETITAIVLVLASFVAFIALLTVAFPRGSSLADLMRGRTTDEAAKPRGSGGNDQGPVAVLSESIRAVKQRPATAIEWRNASPGMSLEDRHAVQTLSGAEATIDFGEQSSLRLGENSLVVIKRLEPLPGISARRASLALLGGEIRGSIGGGGAARVQVELGAGSSPSHVNATGSGAAEVRVSVNPDRSTTVSVLSGAAEIGAADRTVAVRSNHSVVVSASGVPGAEELLPAVPDVLLPPDGAIFYYRSVPPEVSFSWSPGPHAEGVRLMIARDAGFSAIVYDDRIERPPFVHGNLESGKYYWRTAGARGWSEGGFGPTRSFEVVQDNIPPRLEVGFPAGVVAASRIVLRGKTEPGAKVFVAKNPVPVAADGSFEHEVVLKPGMNVVVVEAVDAAGNVAYQSQFVNAKFQAAEETR